MPGTRGTYRRVLLKLSGEVFGGEKGIGVDPDVVQDIAKQIADVARSGVQVAIVVGGGNYFRGAELSQRGMDRSRADYMGMLGTVMNCLALQDFLEKEGVQTRVQTAITMGQVAEPYIPLRAIRHLEKGRVVIFGAGAGMPFFTTDTVSAQRALEIGAEALLLAKSGVDGVYSADPKKDKSAVKFDAISYDEVLSKSLAVADAAAFALCRENQLPIVIFDLMKNGNIARAVRGETIGTLVSQFKILQSQVGYCRQNQRVKNTKGDVMADVASALKDADTKMSKAVEVAKDDFASIRTGRAHPSMFNKIMVDYYGTYTALSQLASIQVPEARMATIAPFDKGSMVSIEKAIRESDLGVNPGNDGVVIRINFPQLTEERRKEFIKVAKGKAEDSKISMRNIRRAAKEAMEKMEKDGDIGKDDLARGEKELEKVTSDHVAKIDELLKHKEAELLEV